MWQHYLTWNKAPSRLRVLATSFIGVTISDSSLKRRIWAVPEDKQGHWISKKGWSELEICPTSKQARKHSLRAEALFSGRRTVPTQQVWLWGRPEGRPRRRPRVRPSFCPFCLFRGSLLNYSQDWSSPAITLKQLALLALLFVFTAANEGPRLPETMGMQYRDVQKNSCMFESLLLAAHWPRQPMHSTSALTELSSQNLPGTFSHDLYFWHIFLRQTDRWPTLKGERWPTFWKILSFIGAQKRGANWKLTRD